MDAASHVFTDKKSTNVRSKSKSSRSKSKEQWIERALRCGFSLMAPVSPALTAVVAEKLFFKAFRFPEPSRERAILETGHRMTFSGRCAGETVELACWSWGDGPTVFLLHGWSGRAGQLGGFVAPLVEAGYSVIAFDAPAHGRSNGKSASGLTFSSALSQLVRRFGPAHAVIAHSMGGWAAAHALLEGMLAERVVLIGAPTDPSAFRDQFSTRFGLSSDIVERLMVRTERRLGLKREEFELSGKIYRAPARALIVHDQGDTEVPFKNAEAWASSWPGASLHVTQGLGHYQILRDADLHRRVLEFIK